MSYYSENIVMEKPELLESVAIIDEQKTSYSVEEFLDLLKKWKIKS